MIPTEVQAWIEAAGFGGIASSTSVTGGCISNGRIVTTTRGPSFFLKTNPSAPPDMFEREVEGLKALARPGAPRVPEPAHHGQGFLLLENLAPAPKSEDYWEEFGRQLASLHLNEGDQFGFSHNNYIGSTPQLNAWSKDGHTFFARHRLLYMAGLVYDAGNLDSQRLASIERLARQLTELVPRQPASLIHGDLWSGNAISDQDGMPALIDPAAHFGWGEAELAMTHLFGRFPPSFYAAYQEIRPLAPGFQSRYPIYNLYHLLNHLHMFGGSYLGQVQQTLAGLSV